MKVYNHLWDYDGDTTRRCRHCGEVEFCNGKNDWWLVIRGNKNLCECATTIKKENK